MEHHLVIGLAGLISEDLPWESQNLQGGRSFEPQEAKASFRKTN